MLAAIVDAVQARVHNPDETTFVCVCIPGVCARVSYLCSKLHQRWNCIYYVQNFYPFMKPSVSCKSCPSLTLTLTTLSSIRFYLLTKVWHRRIAESFSTSRLCEVCRWPDSRHPILFCLLHHHFKHALLLLLLLFVRHLSMHYCFLNTHCCCCCTSSL
jgi:hypothetical protein